ncbi:MAG: DUF4301 family protein [Bacteroidales bacterium]
MFTQQDKKAIKKRGLTLTEVEKQLQSFRKGFPPLDILGPATPGNGITCLTAEEQQKFAALYDSWKGSRVKFVPASGAASRMFSDLFQARETLHAGNEQALSIHAKLFFSSLREFAFYPILEKQHIDLTDKSAVLDALLMPDAMGYANLPKGLIPFHKYAEAPKTPFEEHLTEAALSMANHDGTASLHFTVSKEHEPLFMELWKEVEEKISRRFNLVFSIDFSTQSPSTDTIAVDLDNNPFRKSDGTLLFRPGGHGALLKNLNTLREDLIVIRNIDNVVPESRLDPVIYWRRVLAGYLVECQKQVHTYIYALQENPEDENLLDKATTYLERTFSRTNLPVHPGDVRSRSAFLLSLLDRPIRICGMVPVTGEPGGGPFRVRESDGSSSLQILEEVQLNEKKHASTHFNPVDIVCSIKDSKGKPYDLLRFADEDTGFISHKTLEGKELKALEWPGLWNGAMSRWNTVFIEVPISTFNPVKTVMDLLRKEHNN